MKIICLILSLMIIALINNGASKYTTLESRQIQEDIKAIINEPVEYNTKIIYGDLNIINNEKKTIDREIYIKDSIFNGSINLSNIEFKERIIFENVSFDQFVDISNSKFDKECEFRQCKFNRGLNSNESRFERIFKLSGSSIVNASSRFKYARFNGNAEFYETKFGYADFSGAIFSIANFENATFDYGLFEGSLFNKDSVFKGSIFKRLASFYRAKFYGIAVYTDSRLSNAGFENCEFYKLASFGNTTLNNRSKFSRSKFFDISDFSNSKFFGELWIYSSNFYNNIDFKKAEFKNSSIFTDSIFNNQTEFSWTNFSGSSADFSLNQFNGPIYFDSAIFKANASFYNSKFKDNAIFYKSKFLKDISFNESKFSSNVYLEDISIFGTLDLEKTEYNKLYIRLDNINNIKYNEGAYKALIENFKKLGLFEDAYQCYYRFMVSYAYENLMGFKIIKIIHEKTLDLIDNPTSGALINLIGKSLRSIYYVFAWTLYGFGTKPDFTLIWSFILIIIFGFYWYHVSLIKNCILNDEYDWNECIEGCNQEKDLRSRILAIISPFLLSAAIFLSGTKFFIDPPEIPDYPARSDQLVKWVYSIERFLGGVFSLLFIISIGSMISAM